MKWIWKTFRLDYFDWFNLILIDLTFVYEFDGKDKYVQSWVGQPFAGFGRERLTKNCESFSHASAGQRCVPRLPLGSREPSWVTWAHPFFNEYAWLTRKDKPSMNLVSSLTASRQTVQKLQICVNKEPDWLLILQI